MTPSAAASSRDPRPTLDERLQALDALTSELRQDADAVEQVPLLPVDRLRRLGEQGFVDTWVLESLPADPRRDLPPEPAERRVGASLAAACGPTYFVWSQQLTPLRRLSDAARNPVAGSWLARLRQGSALAAISFAWLRRPGPPALSAASGDSGIVVAGEADWVTGFGLADVLLAAAVDDDAVVHWLLIPFRPETTPPGLSVSTQQLLAMSPTGTVRVRLDQVTVPRDHELATEPLADWLQADRSQGQRPSTGALGVASEAIRRLADQPGSEARRASERLASALRQWRWRVATLDAADPASAELAQEREALRAEGIELALRASAALVSACGGSAMRAGHPAGRLAREALFYVVQAQGPASRAANLARLSAPLRPAPPSGPARP